VRQDFVRKQYCLSYIPFFFSNIFQAAKFPSAPIYGGSDKVLALTHLVKDKDELKVGDHVQIKYVISPQITNISISAKQLLDVLLHLATPKTQYAITSLIPLMTVPAESLQATPCLSPAVVAFSRAQDPKWLRHSNI
jgi:hypothetical protein